MACDDSARPCSGVLYYRPPRTPRYVRDSRQPIAASRAYISDIRRRAVGPSAAGSDLEGTALLAFPGIYWNVAGRLGHGDLLARADDLPVRLASGPARCSRYARLGPEPAS